MKTAIEVLSKLIRNNYCFLSDEHLAFDQWALDWQEHSRKKPNQEYTSAIWAMTKGYLDALNGADVPRRQRAIFREQITNLGLLCTKEIEQSDSQTLILRDDKELVSSIQILEKDITKYFSDQS